MGIKGCYLDTICNKESVQFGGAAPFHTQLHLASLE